MQSGKTIAPRIWGTITWKKTTVSAKQELDSICKFISQKYDIHIFCDMHEGIQLKRYKKTGIKYPDFHFVLGWLEDGKVTTSKMIDILEHQIFRKNICDYQYMKIDPYDKTKGDIWYTFCGHKDFHQGVYCNHKTKCRKRGCKYKKDLNLVKLVRYYNY
jgi:hypothetical protein